MNKKEMRELLKYSAYGRMGVSIVAMCLMVLIGLCYSALVAVIFFGAFCTITVAEYYLGRYVAVPIANSVLYSEKAIVKKKRGV